MSPIIHKDWIHVAYTVYKVIDDLIILSKLLSDPLLSLHRHGENTEFNNA